MKAQLGGKLESVRFTYDQQEIQLIVESLGPEEAPLWLLLPALSTVSSRSEWIELAHATNTKGVWLVLTGQDLVRVIDRRSNTTMHF